MTRDSDTVWSFETARFRVALEISPEEMDPADSFEFDDDIEAVRSGAVEWFCATVTVYFIDRENDDLREIGFDTLGGCAYKTVREFYTSHRDKDPMNRNCSLMRAAHAKEHEGRAVVICHYFPDMVRQAIHDARRHLARNVTAMCA